MHFLNKSCVIACSYKRHSSCTLAFFDNRYGVHQFVLVTDALAEPHVMTSSCCAMACSVRNSLCYTACIDARHTLPHRMVMRQSSCFTVCVDGIRSCCGAVCGAGIYFCLYHSFWWWDMHVASQHLMHIGMLFPQLMGLICALPQEWCRHIHMLYHG